MFPSKIVSLLRRNKTLASSFISHVRDSPSSRVLNERFRFFASKTSNSSSFSGWSSFYAFLSLQKGFSGQCSRNISTTTAHNAKATKGLKLLVTKGPQAEILVGLCLFGCAACVFSIVVIGGVTRLTRSGLSMADWKFFSSHVSAEELLLEFEKYKQAPEYKRVTRGISIEDNELVYRMEYAHLMWGRELGWLFALPFSYLLAEGFITHLRGVRLSALFALGAGQGFIGWWTVKSGLEEPASEYVQPRVSPYRLAIHLTSAFVIYCGLYWTALSVALPEPPCGSLSWVHGAAKVQKLAIPVCILMGITAVSGAFVAGYDAMGDRWIPEDILSMEPLFHNFFGNTSTVQLGHCILAFATLLSIGGFWWATRKLDLHPEVRSLIGGTMGMAAVQVTLGISTLLSYFPVSFASAHQAGAIVSLTLMVHLAHLVRKPSPALLKSLASLPKSNH